jgi:nicotinamide-nucleotide amidase
MNNWGTAPAMLFEKDGKYLVSMPGVPMEMKEIMTHRVLPFLHEKFELPPLVHRSYLTEGIPESELMKTIEAWEDALPPSIRLAYLPSVGQVKLRMSSLNEDGHADQLMDEQEKKLKEIICDEIFGYDEDTLEGVIKKLLEERNQSITTAESCTGGFIAHRLTCVPGVSKVYPGSIVTYDYWVKTELLGVRTETLEKYGAVSRQTVMEMAEGAKKKMRTDYAIAVSGIAGPDGGTPEKPVGTVWMAWATPDGIFAKQFLFGNNRAANIHRSYQSSLNILRKLMLGLEIKEGFWEK